MGLALAVSFAHICLTLRWSLALLSLTSSSEGKIPSSWRTCSKLVWPLLNHNPARAVAVSTTVNCRLYDSVLCQMRSAASVSMAWDEQSTFFSHTRGMKGLPHFLLLLIKLLVAATSTSSLTAPQNPGRDQCQEKWQCQHCCGSCLCFCQVPSKITLRSV